MNHYDPEKALDEANREDKHHKAYDREFARIKKRLLDEATNFKEAFAILEKETGEFSARELTAVIKFSTQIAYEQPEWLPLEISIHVIAMVISAREIKK